MESESSTTWKKTFLVLNCILLTLSNCGAPLIIRLYFIKGGKRIWLSSFIQTAAGAAVLALHTSGDRPEGVSKKEYALGFIFTLFAAALAGFNMPLLEFTYLKAKQTVTYTMVLEIQLVACFFASSFCTVGMIINKDFQAISREARQYELGETKYYLVLVGAVILAQGFYVGIVAVIFYGSSLLSGIIVTVSLPIIELLAVLFFDEKFQSEKGVALFPSLWGFVSYFFGERKQSKKNIHQTQETEIVRAGDS
ncbi:Purine permease 1 [Forsythia ovata]|uniref:Purine permease 1 n=1 Tax=Forsythia ovata TaxID=205694 RepID=A0ABD1TRG8_9LAMI